MQLVRRLSLAAALLCVSQNAALRAAEPAGFMVYVTNERSGDVSVIDGATNSVVETIPVGKRPRGVQTSPDGKLVYLVLSGSPRMAPGVETERAPADKSADALVKIDAATRKVIERWHVGSDPEQFVLSRDGKFAFIANEDDASASIIDLDSGQVAREGKSVRRTGGHGPQSSERRRLRHL